MTVDPARAAGSYEYGGKKWYFCSRHCLEKFQAEPEKYTGARPAIAQAMASVATPTASPVGAAGVTYTCPMHPEVVRNRPGACPICGMALEPTTVALDQEENSELADMTRRFWTSAILTAPVLLMTMGEMIVGGAAPQVSERFAVWIQLALSTPVVLWGGWPFFPPSFRILFAGIAVKWRYISSRPR